MNGQVASPLLGEILTAAARKRMMGMRAVMQREADFPSRLQAQLTGLGLDPDARDYANLKIDEHFQSNRLYRSLPSGSTVPEVVIGSGVHAATYVATRALTGKPVPYVLERAAQVGGAFAIRAADGTYPGVFNLNSRNRRGNPGLSGDNEAQLNYLPGAPIQASALSNAEYQSNADIAFVTRLTLAQYAGTRAWPGVEVTGIERQVRGDGADDVFAVSYIRSSFSNVPRVLYTKRIIDARGQGNPKGETVAGGNVVTFPQFMQRMTGSWPLRGLRNVAVVGGGDSGRSAIESLLGLGPQSVMAAAELDSVNRVHWYAAGVGQTYDEYCATNRGRYRAIGRYLRPDKMGNQRLTVYPTRKASPLSLPDGPALVNGRSYDLVIMATGNQVPKVEGLDFSYTQNVETGGRVIAKRREDDYGETVRYRVGPRANIDFDAEELRNGVADIENNRVAMFRLTTRTAALAVKLS